MNFDNLIRRIVSKEFHNFLLISNIYDKANFVSSEFLFSMKNGAFSISSNLEIFTESLSKTTKISLGIYFGLTFNFINNFDK